MNNKIELSLLVRTKPLAKWERQDIELMMMDELKKSRGKSKPYRYSVGDTVVDICAGDNMNKMIVVERYRENGHNKYATNSGFYREMDLNKVRG